MINVANPSIQRWEMEGTKAKERTKPFRKSRSHVERCEREDVWVVALPWWRGALSVVSYEERGLWEEVEDSSSIHYFLEKCNIYQQALLIALRLEWRETHPKDFQRAKDDVISTRGNCYMSYYYIDSV